MLGLICETCMAEVAERPFEAGESDVVLCGECFEELRGRLKAALEPFGVDVPRNLQRNGRALRWHPKIVRHPLEAGAGPGR